MRLTATASRVLEAALIVAVVSLVLGQLLGQPILLGFVETDSMQPTLAPDDGFIAIPSPFIGSIEEGDVIVFEAQELHGGGLTTHRVIERTRHGYITKGDANPFIDQDGDEPPVKDEQVVAKVLQFNGEVVVVPSLGTAVDAIRDVVSASQSQLSLLLGTSLFLGTQGFLNLIVGMSILIYIFFLLNEQQTRQRSRRRSREDGLDTRYLVAAMTLVILIAVTATMVLPAGTHQIAVESQIEPETQSSGLQPGKSTTATTSVPNSGVVPIFVIFEQRTEGITADPAELYIEGRTVSDVDITVTASQEATRVNRILVEHRYLALLPKSLIHRLYFIHPWAPIVVIDALVALPFYLLGVRLVGTGRMRDRSRNGGLPIFARLRRLYRSLY